MWCFRCCALLVCLVSTVRDNAQPLAIASLCSRANKESCTHNGTPWIRKKWEIA